MKDPKHTMGKRGCRRCALGARDNGGNCPPGYWMTAAEIVKWDMAVGPVEQRAVERAAIERRAARSGRPASDG